MLLEAPQAPGRLGGESSGDDHFPGIEAVRDSLCRDAAGEVDVGAHRGVGHDAGRFQGADFAPAASFELLLRAYEVARLREIPVRVGTVLTSDTFYSDSADFWKKWARYGVLAVEMETAALYTIAAGFGAQAFSILTASDNLVSRTAATTEQRRRGYTAMIELGLEVAAS